MDYIGGIFFSNFGVRHVVSQSFFHENQHFCVLFDHIVIFPHLFEVKKTRIEIWHRLVEKSDRELRYLTISEISDNVGTKTTSA